MKKSNLILAGIVVLLLLLGVIYLIPLREGAVADTLLLAKKIPPVMVSRDQIERNKSPKNAVATTKTTKKK